ncbi:Gfo/Idh/MocA family protein [Neomoorella thermoacetica]|uniref:Gfo/Idh/MocA family protein n=1 Tax=Neomoorella thermoacetica TaxID=1525 RepID=UPI0008FA22CB|nr:Gfo/Idh/MocA family oxidoreductase [Moorella thermoacetica]OIQ11009.1 1,5-anhydro-D-fructose reductase [Moorella thermoacetica]
MQKIRFGILGAARIAHKKLLPAIRAAANADVLGLASRDQERAREIAEVHGIPRIYPSYEALLDDPEIDAIYIPLPNSLHREWTIRAAEKGKHILCEKPAALNAQECEEMIAFCREHSVLFMEAFMYRFHPQHIRVREIISSGRIGEPLLIRAHFSFSLNEPSEDIRLVPELGGGALYDVGCYCINISRWYFSAEPFRVYVTAKLNEVDIASVGILEFPDGKMAIFDCALDRCWRQGCEVVGTRGKIEIPLPFNPEKEPTSLFISMDGQIMEEKIDGCDQYQLQVESFAQAILKIARFGGSQASPYPASDTLQNMRVIDACYRSMRTGVPVEVSQG